MNNKARQYLSPNEVAELMLVSPVTVRQWAQKGWIHAEVTAGKHRRFLLSEVERFAIERGITLQFPEDENLRVLVVDDNIDLAEYLKELLKSVSDSVAIELAHDGFEAGQKVEGFKPDIVLLDLMMPGLDGFEVCRRLKKDPLTRNIRVIAMTGFYSEENVDRIINAGAEICLAKPFRSEDLINVLGLNKEIA